MDVFVGDIAEQYLRKLASVSGTDKDSGTDRTDYIDLYPNNDLNHTCAPENISGHFGLLFLRAPHKFQFYFTLLKLIRHLDCGIRMVSFTFGTRKQK